MSERSKDNNIFDLGEVPSIKELRFGIVVADWNLEISENLLIGCKDALKKIGVLETNVHIIHVPGSVELIHGAKLLIDLGRFDAIICLGCILKGETPHFEIIAHAVAKGVVDLNMEAAIPTIFGVLTPNTIEQARERSGRQFGNKGMEAAVTAIKMIMVQQELQEKSEHN